MRKSIALLSAAFLLSSTAALGADTRPDIKGFWFTADYPAAMALGDLVGAPQLASLIAVSVLLFAIGYVLFQRQEIRA
jgi:hypothetical protein